MKKTLWPISYRSIEHDKCQRTLSRDQKLFWQLLCKLWVYSYGTQDVDATPICEKKAVFHEEKKILAFFCIIEFEKAQKTNCKVRKVFSQLLWKLKDHFCIIQEVVENTNFRKKGNHSSDKN